MNGLLGRGAGDACLAAGVQLLAQQDAAGQSQNDDAANDGGHQIAGAGAFLVRVGRRR